MPTDEKRRYQYIPVDEAPPEYEGSSSTSNPNDRSRRPQRTRADSTVSQSSHDSVDALERGDGLGQDDNHGSSRSVDEARRSIEQLEVEEPTAQKDPIHVRISREWRRLTAHVDGVVHRYIPAGVLRYAIGILLGCVVVVGVYFFGGSMPRLKLPKHYQEDALRSYINTRVAADGIIRTVDEVGAIIQHAHTHGNLMDYEREVANYVQSKLVDARVGRNALDDFYVFRSWPVNHGLRLVIDPRTSDNQDKIEIELRDYAHNVWKTYIGHAPPGNATGPLVYAHAATVDDLERVKDVLPGSVVLFKRDYSVGLGEQLELVTTYGVSGAAVYFPQSSYDETDVMPNGPLPPRGEVQLDDAAYAWIQPGDVLTPGEAAHKHTRPVSLNDNKALGTVPFLAVSAHDAAMMIDLLTEGDPGEGWDAQLPSTLKHTHGPAVAELQSMLAFNEKSIVTNAMGEIEGSEADGVVVIGTSLSSPSGVALLLEIARVFAGLAEKHTWRPRRALIFAFWSGTQENHLGSVEWAEEQRQALRQQGFAYIDITSAIPNPHNTTLDLAGVPSLESAVFKALEATPDVSNSATARNLFPNDRLDIPSSFTDAIAFMTQVGMATAEVGYGRVEIGRECALTSSCLMSHFDPGFGGHAVLARAVAQLGLALVDEKFVPLEIPAYASRLGEHLSRVRTNHGDVFTSDAETARAIRALEDKARAFDLFKSTTWPNKLADDNNVESPALATARNAWNYAAANFHGNLLRSAAWTTWFEHPIYSPAQHRAVSGPQKGKRPWLMPKLENQIAIAQGFREGSEERENALDKIPQMLETLARTLEGCGLGLEGH
ncbi:hypothetical protein PYCC9005_005842 [Savitreella phatthalungensis]